MMFVQKIQQEKPCRYNVILGHVRASIVVLGKTEIIAHFGCVFVELGIQHAMRIRHILICGLSGSANVFSIISKTVRFWKKCY